MLMTSLTTPTILDVVFFIYLYQRWIYPMDPHRVNEFGTSADDHQQSPVVGGADQQPSLEGGASTEDDAVEPALNQSSDSELSLDGNNDSTELRRRLHKRED